MGLRFRSDIVLGAIRKQVSFYSPFIRGREHSKGFKLKSIPVKSLVIWFAMSFSLDGGAGERGHFGWRSGRTLGSDLVLPSSRGPGDACTWPGDGQGSSAQGSSWGASGINKPVPRVPALLSPASWDPSPSEPESTCGGPPAVGECHVRPVTRLVRPASPPPPPGEGSGMSKERLREQQ